MYSTERRERTDIRRPDRASQMPVDVHTPRHDTQHVCWHVVQFRDIKDTDHGPSTYTRHVTQDAAQRNMAPAQITVVLVDLATWSSAATLACDDTPVWLQMQQALQSLWAAESASATNQATRFHGPQLACMVVACE